MFERDYINNTIIYRSNHIVVVEKDATTTILTATMRTCKCSKQVATALLTHARRDVIEAIAQEVMARQREHAIREIVQGAITDDNE